MWKLWRALHVLASWTSWEESRGGLRSSSPSEGAAEEEQEALDRTQSTVFSQCLPAALGFPSCLPPGPHKHLGSSLEPPCASGIPGIPRSKTVWAFPGDGEGRIGKEQLLGARPAAPALSIRQHQLEMWQWEVGPQ